VLIEKPIGRNTGIPVCCCTSASIVDFLAHQVGNASLMQAVECKCSPYLFEQLEESAGVGPDTRNTLSSPLLLPPCLRHAFA
jgi:hypothetical protein